MHERSPEPIFAGAAVIRNENSSITYPDHALRNFVDLFDDLPSFNQPPSYGDLSLSTEDFMTKISQTKLREQLIEWVGDRSQRQAAESINTPLRTFAGWLAGTHPIRGLLAAYLALWQQHRNLKAAYDLLLHKTPRRAR